MKSIPTLTVLACTTLLASADIDRREWRIEDCPPAVRATVEANARGGIIDEVDLIAIEGKEIYVAEVELPRDRDLKIYISGNGSLVKTREELSLRELPAFIRDVAREYGGTLEDVEKEIAGGKVTFHVEIERKGMPDLELVMGAEGEVIRESEEHDD